MALKTLKDITEIGGFKIMRENDRYSYLDSNGCVDWNGLDEARKTIPIHITDEKNMISFRIQDGPINENGVNGCQVDTILLVAKTIVEGLNKNFPCKENEKAIEKMTEALMWMEERKRAILSRGVEGFNKK